jgi:phosphohistidine phosphatase
MKTLLLLRHAHTAQGSPTGRDFDRPLTEQGNAASLLSGKLLRQKQLKPDLILCSPAVRTHQTADHIIAATRFHDALNFYEQIYEASAEGLVELIAEVAEESASVILVIGHNPGLQELLSRLTGEYALMHPATLARIELDITDWSKLRRATAGETGRLVFALPPEAADAH